jgi:dynactin 1
VRLLERKRLEDREVKKSLDQAVQERDQYKGIIEKIQTKYRPQQQENAELKQKLSEVEKKYAEIESIQAEHDSAMEMVTLDREMAEEKAEGYKDELDALRQHNEEMQLELEVLREEKDELTKDMSPEDRASAGWIHLQTQNDKLTKALLALRDRFMDEKEDLNEQIQSLEDQVKDLDTLRTEHEDTREKLLRSEADTSDLRQQLEVALQAEEMIEELSAQKERLQDNVHELHATIEDLENLKELNDELEINHVEAEKQMQEEIDFKDSLLLDREKTAKLQQDALDDRDTIINQFRNYVRNLESDISDMRASKDITEAEAKALEGKSRAMLDLNLKLQNNATKTQVKTIDLELRRLDAQEASEHLAIVQLFLPEAFHAERDSVMALLRFKRISFKANLIHEFVKERIASFGAKGTDDDVFAACDVVDKLTWITAMAERFVNSICSCSVEDFSNYDSALYELEPVERALNGYIDGLRRDEIKERDMAQELQRSIAVMSHLASIHVKDDLASHADHLLMRTQCLQSQLESAATALQLSKSLVESNVPKDEEEDDDEGSASDLAIILTRAETLVNHVRSAKVMAGKTHRALTDLQHRSLTLESSCTEDFDSTEAIVTEVVSYSIRAGDALQTLFGEEGRNDPFTPSEVAGALSRTAVALFSLQAPEAGPFTSLATRLRDLSDALTDLASLPTDLDNTVEFERAAAPWVARANELKRTKTISIDTEAELAKTLETLRGKDTVIKEKETELEEQSVRIEMLEARMKDASKRSAKIAELERNLHEAKDAERKAKREVERAKEERDRDVERAREEMGRLGEERKNGAGADLDADAMGAGAKMTMKRQEHKIHGLEVAVRYLKKENHRLRLPSPDSPLSAQSTLDWLHRPLCKQKSDARQRHETALKEGKDLLQQLLSVASMPQTIDLSKMPDNKLAWRPAKESSRWKVEKRKEEWEMWKDWRKEVVLKGSGRLEIV